MLLLVGILSGIMAIVGFMFHRNLIVYLSLFICCFLVRMHFSQMDPFLHDWDERYHALVAKNMMQDPFVPMLRTDPVLDYKYTAWWDNHIWLHKQPLFLWQMALSMKIFGVNEFAVRFPSMILCALLAMMIFRIGNLLQIPRAGLFASLLFCFSFFAIEQTTGAIGMDHNDIAMLFYIMASHWCLLEYYRTKKLFWAMLTGIFAGAAVLVKWLTGLLVFFTWTTMFIARKLRPFKKEFLHFTISFICSLIIFLPWQIYTLQRFPVEAKYELQYNSEHIFHAVEGHRGSKFYYLGQIDFQYGHLAIPLLVAGIVLLLLRKYNRAIRIFLLAPVLAVYLFFSVIAVSKGIGYVFIVAPLLMLMMGIAVDSFVSWISSRVKLPVTQTLFILLITTGSIFSFKYNELEKQHTSYNDAYNWESRNSKIHNTEIYKGLDSYLQNKYVVFNCNKNEAVEAMFYSGQNVYASIPEENVYDSLRRAGLKMAAFKERDGYTLPEYMKQDSDLVIINRELK